MFDYIKGTLAEKNIGTAVIEACGVGYLLIIPLSTYEKLPPVNHDVKLFTHHYVREDMQRLYGFFSKQEREIFEQLIGISKIGPKTAISILSGVSPADLISYVNKSDATRLRKIPGVGDKTAQRLVMELKGKLGLSGLAGGDGSARREPGIASANPRSEAFDAMITLGYADKQVQSALTRVETVIAADALAEEWIKKALQVI
ncbi:MAG: Holliday junction branch migration protein RuvA [Chitinivibrionales bacterium]